MEDSHRAKKRRTETWSPAESGSGNTKSHKKSYRDSETYGHGRGKSYRPNYSYQEHSTRRPQRASPSPERKRPRPHRPETTDSYKPRNGTSRDARTDNTLSNRSRPRPQQFQPNNHTTKSRKTNPSSRIHSLRKQLAHASAATLPANILADKQRELQFLLDSRQSPKPQDGANKSSRDRREKKMLSQYHMVRFFERKKAERNLKRARKQLENAEEDEDDTNQEAKQASPEALREEIERHACDLLYCLFAPLGEKYIAMFAGEGQSEKSKARSAMKKAQGLKEDGLPKDNPHIIRISTQSQDDTFRPPYWYTIQTILQDSPTKDTEDGGGDLVQVPQDNDAWTSVSVTSAQLLQLEALRDGKDKPDAATSNTSDKNGVGLAVRAKEPVAGKKRKAASWQDETNEPVDPADADSDSVDGGVALKSKDDDDESDSDGDGGFFER